ncbi:MAG: site-2 protease family protein [Pirellulaceae bacterium]
MGSPLLVDTILSGGANFLLPLESAVNSLLLLGETSYLQGLMNSLTNIGQVALGLGFVIFVHELGHFLAAKTFGVRCDKFYVGFDPPMSIGPIRLPRTLGKFQWGETEYGIGIIPLGGYVKMLGQDDDPRQAEAEAERIRLGDGEDAPLDPRSFPAKPVWQRMIIISAGVVMNLIFAVIMAGVAFWYGVPYTPTVVGGTLAGGPAWEAGVEPGDQILSFNSNMEDDPNLRYQDFATGVVIRGLDKKAEPLTLAALRGQERLEIGITPTNRFSQDGYFMIGVMSPQIPTLGPQPIIEGEFLDRAGVDLQEGDVIKSVNGEELPIDPRYDAVLASELNQRLNAYWRDTVTLTVERPAEKADQPPQILKVELPPVPVKTLGVGFAPGPVSAIQRGSIADNAGFKVGDIIEAVNGEKVVDALRIPDTVARLAGQEVTLTIRRPGTGSVVAGGSSDSQETPTADETFEITFTHPPQAGFEMLSSLAGSLSLAGVGLAFDVSPKIAMVEDAVAEKTGSQWATSSPNTTGS